MPKASFVVASYNAAHYLPETIESIRRQTEEDIEIIIVDDGSRDTTNKLCEYYLNKDKRIVHVEMGENAGRSAARNVGCLKSSSDIILISDADDVQNLERADKTIKYFDANKDIGIVYGGFWIMDEVSRVLNEVKPEKVDFDEMITEPRMQFGIAHSTMSFRKDVFEKVKYSEGPWSDHGIDDWKFQVDAWKAGVKFGMIPEPPLMYYRMIQKQRDEEEIMRLKRSVV